MSQTFYSPHLSYYVIYSSKVAKSLQKIEKKQVVLVHNLLQPFSFKIRLIVFEIELVDFRFGGRPSNGISPTNYCGNEAATIMDFPLVLFLQESLSLVSFLIDLISAKLC